MHSMLIYPIIVDTIIIIIIIKFGVGGEFTPISPLLPHLEKISLHMSQIKNAFLLTCGPATL